VNPHLQLLLSPIYDGDLAAAHRADLEQSGLSKELIRAQFIRSVPPAMIGPLLGFDRPDIGSALLFPFASPAGGFMDLARVKIFPALTDKDGHRIKYLQPRRSAPRLYFVRHCLHEVLEGHEPLWLVEGEKKALNVAQRGLPAVGFCGVEGWHAKGDRRLLEDFTAIRLRDRIVEVLPDGDYKTNPNVTRAIQRLGAALTAEGARPRVVLLPSESPR
jgi:Domain of unknown function (DUF3854)